MTTAAAQGCPTKCNGKWVSRIQGFGRSSGQREKPAEASNPEQQAAIFKAVATWPTWLALTGIIVAAALLRVLPWLTNYPLHRDEALYGSWARLIASGRDSLLLTPWIDKPPLSIYAGAASIAAFGPSELALRLPGMLASILTVPATYGLARCVYGGATGERTARLAAGLLALSPFAILFAPTAFTDPWLTLWLVVAAWAALARRGLAAGLALGLAVASKQQGLLAIPLIVSLLLLPADGALPVLGGSGTHRGRRSELRSRLAALVGFALVFGPLTYWDSLRWHNRPSFWDHSLATYGWLGVAAPAVWPGRAAEWATQLGYLFGLPVLSWLMLGLAAAAVIAAVIKAARRQPERERRLDLIFGAYAAGYLALHVVVTFQPWDRYLLPLLPLICLLAARGLAWCRDSWLVYFRNGLRAVNPLRATANTILQATVTLLLAGALSYGAWLGAAGRIPVGSDHGAYAGIRQVADALRSQPNEAIFYHHSLGWYFDFYLFDTPQERRWYDAGPKLADDAARTMKQEPGRPQWLIVTDSEVDATEALSPLLAARGLALTAPTAVKRPDGSRSFAIYGIVPAAGKGLP